ncbi:hypothetical protein Cadr_000016433, partial [Camelus dromedarius]
MNPPGPRQVQQEDKRAACPPPTCPPVLWTRGLCSSSQQNPVPRFALCPQGSPVPVHPFTPFPKHPQHWALPGVDGTVRQGLESTLQILLGEPAHGGRGRHSTAWQAAAGPGAQAGREARFQQPP